MTFPGVLKCCFQKRRDHSWGLHNTNHKVAEVYSQKFHLRLHPPTSTVCRSFLDRSRWSRNTRKYFTLSTRGACAKAFCNMNQASVLPHCDAATLLPFRWDNFHSVSSTWIISPKQLVLFCGSWRRVSLCSPDWFQIYSNPPASASQALELQM